MKEAGASPARLEVAYLYGADMSAARIRRRKLLIHARPPGSLAASLFEDRPLTSPRKVGWITLTHLTDFPFNPT